ncbi:MAG: FKBP-type peptidyl-prolyl cis-trans isomerase [Ferruginibacter sp.]
MKKIPMIAVLAIVALSACKESFKKGKNGIEYKLITSGGGEKIKQGQFMQLAVGQYYNNGKTDSLLSDSRTSPQGDMIDVYDTSRIPPEFAPLLGMLRKGDSLVIRVLTDTVFKGPQGIPEPFKKGRYMMTTVKMVDIFKTPEAADSARRKSMEAAQKKMMEQVAETRKKEDKELGDYFKKNNITTAKGTLGTYVQVLQPGTGANADTSKFALVKYTGKTLAGKTFDSNVDPAFQHTEPLVVNLTNDRMLGGNVIDGWKDGFLLLNKGAKAKLYIPSELAYGPQGNGPDIGPNTILVFDVEVLDILSKEQGKAAVEAQQAAQQKKMQEMQQRYMDSIQKANPQPQQKPAGGK